jgi:Fic family protein
MKYSAIHTRVHKKLKELNSLRPIPSHLVKKLKEQFSMEMNYNSNAIEGNTLTLKETIFILKEGITIKNKSLQEHLEVSNQAEAIDYLYDIVEKKLPITERVIRTIHSLVIQKIDEGAGSYRTQDVRISGSKHVPPSGFEVQSKMQDLLRWFSKNEKTLDPILLATEFKYRLVAIHPFIDGNGRTSRIAMNIILMRAGFPLTVILKNDRQKYYRALAKADRGSIEDLTFLILQSVERSLEIYLKALLPSKKEGVLLPVSVVATKTPYSAEYISHLIRKGMIAGVKNGRNWETSIQAVEEYIKNIR